MAGPTVEHKKLQKDNSYYGTSTEDSPAVAARRKSGNKLKTVVIFLLALYGLSATIWATTHQFKNDFGTFKWGWPHRPSHPAKKNMIFMVSDGMGPASISMARSWREYSQKLPELTTLGIDQYFVGNSRSRSSDSLVTDSAAGATAFSCGLKTYNGAIGVDPKGVACGTVLEAAKLAGYHTGLVVTTRITDATPAAFAAHASFRTKEDHIAQQLLGHEHLLQQRPADLVIGGGRMHFQPTVRKDGQDLLKQAAQEGWQLVSDRREFDMLQQGSNVSLPLLALLAEGDIPFELDRNPEEYPSLKETVQTALKALELATADSEHGFFLLIEGSRIDHAGHLNDPAAQVREVAAYSDAYEAVVEFVNSANTETIVLSTSDHETGGLSVAKQLTPSYPDYLWLPEALENAKHSVEYLVRKLGSTDFKSDNKRAEKFVRHEILGPNGLGLKKIRASDVDALVKSPETAFEVLANAISRAAQVGWATHGHSAVDVNVYAYAKNPRLIDDVRGPNENIDFNGFMTNWLGLTLPKWGDVIPPKD